MKNIFVGAILFVALLFPSLVVFAGEMGPLEAATPIWFKYLEFVGLILAGVVLVQGMIMISSIAGGSLARSFMWYPVGAVSIGAALVLRIVMEWTEVNHFFLELSYELFIYAGLLLWIIGTQKAINSLKG